MTYAEANAWLDSFANLERRMDPGHWSGVKLERVERLVAALGHPERHGRGVHIAGTKGKGSTAAMVDSVLRAAGYRTGLYTSPHLVSPRERIRIDGAPIAEADLAGLVADRLRPAAESLAPDPELGELSFFDLHTALAFCAFQEAGVDWQVIEVGLGGRLDATNVVSPEACAITTIGLEHTAFLGTTLAAIAGEKAGIIKRDIPVVVGPQPPEAGAVIARTAATHQAPLHLAGGVAAVPGADWRELDGGRFGQRVDVAWLGEPLRALDLPLLGSHQVENAAVARTVLEVLAREGHARLGLDDVAAGLAATQWPGRLQVLERRPWLVLDGAHTPVAAERLVAALARFPARRRWLVIAAARDKDFGATAAKLCRGAAGVVATGLPANPRSATVEAVAAALAGHCPQVAAEPDPASALALALGWAAPDDLVCVTGSLYLVGAILGMRQGDEPA